MIRAAAFFLAGAIALAAPVAGTLDIYWIDVEGGASTLIVTPQRQTVLVDAGWAGFNDRDPKRIEQVVRQEAGLSRIDYLLLTHFHADHAGGVDALAARVPIDHFIDHGDLVETTADYRALWNRYVALAGARRHVAKSGERVPLDGVDLVIVASDGHAMTAPVPGGGAVNPACREFKPQPEDRTENGRSLGFWLRAGSFRFVSLGDLSWNGQSRLACPANLLGSADLFQVTHHGVRDDVLPQQMWPMRPAVAVMNNGPAKGAGPVAVETVLHSPGLTDLWSLHRELDNDPAHNAPESLTANLGDTPNCPGYWIRARVNGNGTYTLRNSRNGFEKTYRIK